MEKPKIFIGSSVEGLSIAETIFSHIRFETEPIIWKHGLFLPGKFPFEVLEEQLRSNDFAILVATPDDKLEKRGELSDTMRDNILIEFGLFAGVLGRKRCFLVIPDQTEINIPTDLLGIMPAYYDSNRIKKDPAQIEASLQETCRLILKAIRLEMDEREKRLESERTKLMESEKGKALQTLYTVATNIRDTLLVIQTDIPVAFNNFEKYKEIKDKAITAVSKQYDEYVKAASTLNLKQELLSLVDVSKTAISDLPYPDELMQGQEAWKRQAMDTGMKALNTFMRGGDAFGEIRNKAGNEVEMRMKGLKIKFGEWWQKHRPIIQFATAKLQDAIFRESFKLGRER